MSDRPHAALSSAKVYRACASSYVVFTVLTGVPVGINVAALIATGNPSLWWIIAAGTGVLLFVCLCLWRFRLEITADTVAYASLFMRKRMIARSEIVAVGPARRTGRLEGPMTIVIRSKSGEEIRVNAKVFSLEAVRALAALAAGPPSDPSRFSSDRGPA
jgi:hypothetical protein